LMRVYLPRAFLCEKQKTQTCFKDILKRLYLELLLYLVFLCFDQSDLFVKYSIYLTNKKLDVRYYIVQLWQPLIEASFIFDSKQFAITMTCSDKRPSNNATRRPGRPLVEKIPRPFRMERITAWHCKMTT